MPPAAILALFDLVSVVAQESPQIIDAIARLKENGLTPENIAAERAALEALDTSDPLGKVPDPGVSVQDFDRPSPDPQPVRSSADPAAPGPVERPA